METTLMTAIAEADRTAARGASRRTSDRRVGVRLPVVVCWGTRAEAKATAMACGDVACLVTVGAIDELARVVRGGAPGREPTGGSGARGRTVSPGYAAALEVDAILITPAAVARELARRSARATPPSGTPHSGGGARAQVRPAARLDEPGALAAIGAQIRQALVPTTGVPAYALISDADRGDLAELVVQGLAQRIGGYTRPGSERSASGASGTEPPGAPRADGRGTSAGEHQSVPAAAPSALDAWRLRGVLALGAGGVTLLLDVRADGWSALRRALSGPRLSERWRRETLGAVLTAAGGHRTPDAGAWPAQDLADVPREGPTETARVPAGGVQRGAPAAARMADVERPIAAALEGRVLAPGLVRLFELVISPEGEHTMTTRELARRLGVQATTLASRCARARLPAVKVLLRGARVVEAARLRSRGLAMENIAARLGISSPGSLARMIREVTGARTEEFTTQWAPHEGARAVEWYLETLIRPYAPVWRRFDPLAGGAPVLQHADRARGRTGRGAAGRETARDASGPRP